MSEPLLIKSNDQVSLVKNEPEDRRADLARWASLSETRDDEITLGLHRFRDVLEKRWDCRLDEAEFLGFILNWKRLPARNVAAVVLDEVSGKVKAFKASDFVASEEVFVMALPCGTSVMVNLAIPDQVPPGSFRRLYDFVFQVVVLANLLGKIPGAIKKTGRVKVGIREPEITGKKSKVDQVVVNEQPATRLSES